MLRKPGPRRIEHFLNAESGVYSAQIGIERLKTAGGEGVRTTRANLKVYARGVFNVILLLTVYLLHLTLHKTVTYCTVLVHTDPTFFFLNVPVNN